MNFDIKQILCTLYNALLCIGVFSMQSPGLIGVANCFKEQNKPKQEKISEYAQFISRINLIHSNQMVHNMQLCTIAPP